MKQIQSIHVPGAQRDMDVIEDDEGQGAAMLSLKSQVKLKPVELSNNTSAGRLRSRHPTAKTNFIKSHLPYDILTQYRQMITPQFPKYMSLIPYVLFNQQVIHEAMIITSNCSQE